MGPRDSFGSCSWIYLYSTDCQLRGITSSMAGEEAEETGQKYKEINVSQRNYVRKGLKLKNCKDIGKINVIRSSSGTCLEISQILSKAKVLHSLRGSTQLMQNLQPLANNSRQVFPLKQGLRGQIWVRVGLWCSCQVGVCKLWAPSRKKRSIPKNIATLTKKRMCDHNAVMSLHKIILR